MWSFFLPCFLIILFYKELVVFRDLPSLALRGIIAPQEQCFPPNTSVLSGHGVVRVDWKLKVSVCHAHRAGTAWLDLELHQVDATLDTTVLKVHMGVAGRFYLGSAKFSVIHFSWQPKK